MNKVSLSKYLCYLLRHHPESIDLELNSHGWAHIPTLVSKARKHGRVFSEKQIRDVIKKSGKQRFQLSEDKAFIRAGYGHSIPVDLSLEPDRPSEILFHGTAEKNVASILQNGLKAGSRNYVHLSMNENDAVSVGARHGKPIVLSIKALEMHHSGFSFFQSESESGIWLVHAVPAQYIFQKISQPE